MRAQMAIACLLIRLLAAVCCAAEKLPVPKDAELIEAQKTVDEVFAKRIEAATTAETKVRIASEMLEIVKTTEPPALRFALLTGAEKLAVDGRDYKLVVSTSESLAEAFEVNAVERQLAALETLAATAKQTSDHLAVAKLGLERLDDLQSAGEIETAMRFGRIAYAAAKRGRDPEMLKTLEERAAVLTAQKKAAEALATLTGAVEKDPSDAAAQQALGELLCFLRGEWEAGLPHLAQGADETLAALAKRDQVKPADAKERTAIADAWLELSKKAKKERAPALRGRALYWYEQAVTDASGLTKAKLEKQIKELASNSTPEKKPAVAGKTPVGKPVGGKTTKGADEPPAIYAQRDPKVHRKTVDEKQLAAIDAGLAWLARHQRPDGAWSFDHRNGPCKTNPGGLQEAFNGATAMAILPMLASGHTTKEGKHAGNVKAGLAYLIRSIQVKEEGGSLLDGGTFYTHGLASIALCEAYGLTGDPSLKAPAQATINYIIGSQAPDGGWRYAAKQPGDTSVTAWQVQAMYLAQQAGLTVHESGPRGASLFLDSVQINSGASYGYTNPGDGMGTSAAGLYSRLLMGRKFDEKSALLEGAKRIASAGPSSNNMYFNYYATNVLTNIDELGPKWNDALFKKLLTAQSLDGNEKGSWYIPGDHGSERGGRIYCTSLALLMLQSSFRYAK
jgi:hypothetical protein